MPTARENLITRRDNIATELAAMTSTSEGGRASYSVDGQSVSHTEYKDGLYRELREINQALAAIDAQENGPFELLTQGF